MTDRERLYDEYPWIRWHDPVTVSNTEVEGLACRICIAVHGLRGDEIPERLFTDRAEFESHMSKEHPA